MNLIDVDKVIPDRNLSIYEGAIVPLGKYKNAMIFWQIEALLENMILRSRRRSRICRMMR